jgi:hypothetical protein
MDKRTEILEFYSKFKLNKNSYNINFYKKRNAEHIYCSLLHYFDHNPQLKNASLAQKLYHVKIDSEVIPPFEFINCKEGYKKGGIRCEESKLYRNHDWFLKKLNEYEYKNTDITNIDFEKFKKLYKKVAYKKIIDTVQFMEYICKKSFEHSIPRKLCIYKFIFKLDINCPICNDYKKFKKCELMKTCGSDKCMYDLLSNMGKNRDNSHLSNVSSRKKAVESRKNNNKQWHTEETKILISESNKKTWTHEKIMNQVDKNRNGGVYERHSIFMKDKILKGSFTPKSSNRLNHSRLSSDITGLKSYRSSWEKIFHEQNPELLFESVRIPYHYNGCSHVYIVDFEDCKNKILYEIKPSSLIDDPKNLAKHKYAIQWAEKHGYVYKIITEHDICLKKSH